jgi:LAS seventeen-binding protein 5
VVQLVEKEELIGTLIETNDRIISALEAYDQLCAADTAGSKNEDEAAAALAKVHLTGESEVTKLQEKQRVAVERAKQSSIRGKQPSLEDSNLHPDLQDLNFGSIEGSTGHLPAPIRPSNTAADSDTDEYRRGSLSDFSDYESSDEETRRAGPSLGKRDYVTVSDDSDDAAVGINHNVTAKDDPFADPFADEVAVGPSRKW